MMNDSTGVLVQQERNEAYQALPHGHIRILSLAPGVGDAPLQGELICLRLSDLGALDIVGRSADDRRNIDDNNFEYEAISYCWGALEMPQKIYLIDGVVLPVTESLHSALLSFRCSDRPRRLWADAVCINQTNMDERSAQVEMMAEIFRRASEVLVWLGPAVAGGTETLAFATLNAPIRPQGDRSRQELLQLLEHHLGSTTHCQCCDKALPIDLPVKLEDALAAVAKLLERSWFGRLWVVQEVALAYRIRIYCGTHHALWDVFTEISRVPGQFAGDYPYQDMAVPLTWPRGALRQVWARCNYLNQLRARNKSHVWLRNPFRPTALCKDLLMLSHLECQDPRDRIFGVSRVLGLDGFEELRPDYKISVAELYRRTALLYLTASANRAGGRGAQMLALTGTESPAATSTPRPSWVLHLQHLTERSRSKYTYYQWTINERALYADAFEFKCKLDRRNGQILLVRGRITGRITDVLADSACPSKHVHRRSAEKCPDEEGKALIEWYQRCCHYLAAELSAADLAAINNVLAKTFACSHKATSDLQLPMDYSSIIDAWLSTMPTLTGSPGHEKIAQNLSPYIMGHPIDRERNLCIVNVGDRYGTIKDGYRGGWVSKLAQPGDEICYFAGAPYPFLVRHHGEHGYKLLGDAFIQGFDETEALDFDPDIWENVLQKLRLANEELKELKMLDLQKWNNHDTEGSQHIYDGIDHVKQERNVLIQQVKDMYRTADDALGWIELR